MDTTTVLMNYLAVGLGFVLVCFMVPFGILLAMAAFHLVWTNPWVVVDAPMAFLGRYQWSRLPMSQHHDVRWRMVGNDRVSVLRRDWPLFVMSIDYTPEVISRGWYQVRLTKDEFNTVFARTKQLQAERAARFTPAVVAAATAARNEFGVDLTRTAPDERSRLKAMRRKG